MSDEKRDLVTTSVQLRKEQREWLDDMNLNTSQFLRTMLDDAMEYVEGRGPSLMDRYEGDSSEQGSSNEV